jgi:hypothetical protein
MFSEFARISGLLFILSMSILFFPTAGNTAFECYNEKYFPSVFLLQETSTGIRAQLGGVYADPIKRIAPVIEWVDELGWMSKTEKECKYCATNAHVQECKLGVPSVRTPNQSGYIVEKPSACVTVHGNIYFGINFYRGEGYTGTGGFGRYGLQTERLELHRPTELKDIPIHKVVHDGKYIWAATTHNYECIGHPPAEGLVKYDWETKLLYNFKGKNDGPCGFVIHDILWRKGNLWVATDVGLSRWNSKSNRWIHYLPDKNNPENIVTNSCSEFYIQLLSTLPKNETWFDESRSYYQAFYDNLKMFRPDFIDKYESKNK